MDYEKIFVERPAAGVGLVRMKHAPSFLTEALMQEITSALEVLDAHPDIGCLVLAGTDRAFAAGADIKEMAQATPVELLQKGFIGRWERLRALHKPLIAAVSGYALGGGCELALACDMIVASESAVFGQPEINLGVIPGAGGTQRLARTLGKALAMEMVLNDRRLTAAEALQFGLVNRVAPVERYLDETVKLASEIAARAPVAVRFAKEAINMAFEAPLASGLAYERTLFYSLFATDDQKEGMAAFLAKRPAEWKGQ